MPTARSRRGAPDAGGLPALAAQHVAQHLRRSEPPSSWPRGPLPSSNLSLLGLVRHLAKVERIWLRIRAAGEPVEPMYDLALGKDHDFDDIDAALAEQDYRRLLDECALCDAAVADLPFDHTFDNRGEDMSLRMTYVHLIGEYARHNGHADLLREAIDGVVDR